MRRSAMTDTITKIDPERVEQILINCLFKDEELIDGQAPPDAHVYAEGVVNNFMFNPQRLEEHRGEVRAMLDLLPMQFRAEPEGGGGGWSFLNGCVQRVVDQPDIPFEQYPQWTGLQARVDQLFSLGMALGYVTNQMPRALWSVLPGGVPYYTISIDSDRA